MGEGGGQEGVVVIWTDVANLATGKQTHPAVAIPCAPLGLALGYGYPGTGISTRNLPVSGSALLCSLSLMFWYRWTQFVDVSNLLPRASLVLDSVIISRSSRLCRSIPPRLGVNGFNIYS